MVHGAQTVGRQNDHQAPKGPRIGPIPKNSQMAIDMARTKSTQKTQNGLEGHSEATSSRTMGKRPLLGTMERKDDDEGKKGPKNHLDHS
ncbi:hypothetical protein O181_000488 [Austropuccinia psidii MF-1]|uniref:Uncharacterized protein n=1 Tax=Austropuccinia psidii MF-1 TaxID=1389203 RepID=A0A9Q3B8L9_9BASI|nr:hypothetical protein [Austropuccinia psidii MF-1]